MKFDVWKDIVSRSSSRPDLVTLRGVGGPKISENAEGGGIGMKLDGKNNCKS